MQIEFDVAIVPSKILEQPIVMTSGLKVADLPEVMYAIPIQPDPAHDYTDLIRARGALLSEFTKHVVDDPSVLMAGLIPPQGIVIGFNHQKENERLYYLTPVNILTEKEHTADTKLCDSIVINLMLISRSALKDLNKDIEAIMFE